MFNYCFICYLNLHWIYIWLIEWKTATWINGTIISQWLIEWKATWINGTSISQWLIEWKPATWINGTSISEVCLHLLNLTSIWVSQYPISGTRVSVIDTRQHCIARAFIGAGEPEQLLILLIYSRPKWIQVDLYRYRTTVTLL